MGASRELSVRGVCALPREQNNRQPALFDAGFEDRYYSEFDYARTVAAHIGAQHHEALITAKQFADAIPKLIWHEVS
jgi:asparagine synthase (glutamine-hydrolysing)